jgi:hypothetical protein
MLEWCSWLPERKDLATCRDNRNGQP